MRATPVPAPAPLIVGIGGTMRSGSATERVLRAALAATERARRPDAAARRPGPGSADVRAEVRRAHRRARALVDRLGRADGVILASPAYHGGSVGLVKNALDHIEDLRDADARRYLDGRAVGCIACAGGWQAAGATLAGLRSIAHALRGWPTPLGVTSTPPTGLRAGGAVDPAALGQLEVLADQVVSFARMLAPQSPPLRNGHSRLRTA